MPCDNVLFIAAIGIYHSKRNAFVLNHNNLYLHITVKELSIGLLVVFIFTKLYEHGISLPIPILLYACISAAVCKLSFNYYSIQLKYGYEGYRQFSIAPSPGLFPEAEPREINLGEG